MNEIIRAYLEDGITLDECINLLFVGWDWLNE